MYDVMLISPHYDYGVDGGMVPDQTDPDHEDLSMTIPLGIIHIAQYLHDCGHSVRVVHIPHEMHTLRRFGIDPAEKNDPVRTLLKRYPARVCGIQAHWYLYCGGAVFISNLYRELFPDSRIFLGGYMAAACWREFLTAAPGADGVVIGEGEKTFKDIVETCLSGKDGLKNVKGIAFKNSDGTFGCNPPCRDSCLGVDEIPIVRPDSPPFANLIWPRRHFIHISRGLCPEPCSYCVGNNRHLNPRVFNTLKIDRILEQIHVYQAWGINRIFLGENHFLDVPFMTALIEAIIDARFSQVFELETHPVIFENDLLLEKMVQAKFIRYTMGCESGSNSLLKRIGRKSNLGQIKDGVQRIVEKGAVVLTSWISNLPGETASEFKETLDALHQVTKAGGFVYWIENLHVLPGSRIYENPERWGIQRLLSDIPDWIVWSHRSKRYVSFDDVYRAPRKYLTHVSGNLSPKQMIDRFYATRKTARSLVPRMKAHLNDRAGHLPMDVFTSEKRRIDWYESKGWKLWLI